jgi:hypothetical protein
MLDLGLPQHVNLFQGPGQCPDAVVRRGGDTFADIDVAEELIKEAERQGIRILGLEGLLIADDGVYPALSRIAHVSDVTDA